MAQVRFPVGPIQRRQPPPHQVDKTNLLTATARLLTWINFTLFICFFLVRCQAGSGWAQGQEVQTADSTAAALPPQKKREEVKVETRDLTEVQERQRGQDWTGQSEAFWIQSSVYFCHGAPWRLQWSLHRMSAGLEKSGKAVNSVSVCRDVKQPSGRRENKTENAKTKRIFLCVSHRAEEAAAQVSGSCDQPAAESSSAGGVFISEQHDPLLLDGTKITV